MLDWQLLEGRRATRIALHAPFPAAIEDEPGALERLRAWAVTATVRLVEAFRPRLKALAR